MYQPILIYLNVISKEKKQLRRYSLINMKVKSKISAAYLFHFTPRKESLINILRNHFMPFYCMERLDYLSLKNNNNDYFEMAFPLVCFCDIPNPLQATHRKKFGTYGIGLDKSWGIKNGLTPIIYTHSNTILSSNLKYLVDLYPKLENYGVPKSEILGLRNHISYLMMHYKSYEGFAYKKDEKRFDEEITRFYDEREWRYIPLNCNNLKLNLERDEYESIDKLKEENEKIQKCNKLTFQLSDIKYLCLNAESEIQSFLNALSDRYSENDLKILKSLIHLL